MSEKFDFNPHEIEQKRQMEKARNFLDTAIAKLIMFDDLVDALREAIDDAMEANDGNR